MCPFFCGIALPPTAALLVLALCFPRRPVQHVHSWTSPASSYSSWKYNNRSPNYPRGGCTPLPFVVLPRPGTLETESTTPVTNRSTRNTARTRIHALGTQEPWQRPICVHSLCENTLRVMVFCRLHRIRASHHHMDPYYSERQSKPASSRLPFLANYED